MKLSDTPKICHTYLNDLYKMLNHHNMPANSSLGWVNHDIDRIEQVVNNMDDEELAGQYLDVVSYVFTKQLRAQKAAQRKAKGTLVFKEYRDKRNVHDAEWRRFNLARSYMIKLNKNDEYASGHNSIKNPRVSTMEKHGIYKVKGIYYSTIVDEHCQRFGTCVEK